MVKNKFNSRRTLQLILPFLILHLSVAGVFFTTNATVRYVSHDGSNTPPYLTWETAADSIMSAINISVFGDTIYVANGVYEEQVIMIPGLTLIGAGMDSCVIDTRDFVQPILFAAVRVADSCKFKGFNIIVSNDRNSRAIISDTATAIIEFNKLRNAHTSISLRLSNSLVNSNIIQNFVVGLILINSEAIVRNNQLINVSIGTQINAFTGNYYPVIEKNIISCDGFGVLVEFNSRPTIRNNIIFLNGDGANGYVGGGSDTAWVYNNLIVSQEGFDFTRGLANSIRPTFNTNNFLFGNFSDLGINAENFNIIKNNNIMNSPKGIIQDPGDNPIIQYNNSWNNTVNYGGFTPDSTNLSVDPMIISEDSLDFHLQMFSPLIDTGDPDILDVDGSRSDIGLWGGPYGGRYTYRDLAPKPPSNLTAVYDSGFVLLRWNRNTETDFYRYRVYRDTVPNFIYDTTRIIAVVADTFYYDDLPEKYLATDYYYKLTAMDSTGHQSATSEEVHVTVTGVPEGPPIVVEEYKLLQNYPNPFNPSTKIPYRLKEGGNVKLTVYNFLGELIAVLVNEYQDKGYYEVEFRPNSIQRSKGKIGRTGVEFPTGYNDDIASGLYVYQLTVSENAWVIKYLNSGKMILLR